MSVFTLFFGTFIHLPRTAYEGKPALEINQGVLWVSTFDGRIKGFNWNIRDEEGLRSLMEKENWVEENRWGLARGIAKIKIVRAREDQNEFFFPGLIGMLYSIYSLIG